MTSLIIQFEYFIYIYNYKIIYFRDFDDFCPYSKRNIRYKILKSIDLSFCSEFKIKV